MDAFQLQPFIIPTLISISLVWFITKWFYKPATDKNPPPSPPKLLILGNLHQLGSSAPHRSLHSLAEKHGPLMIIHLGSSRPTLVVSSADAACEILKTHDLSFAYRPQNKTMKKLMYNYNDVFFSSYGEHWRQAKSICVIHLLSNKMVESFHSIREEETTLLMKRILHETEGHCPVNLTKMLADFNNDVISRTVMGRKYSESENGKRFLMLVAESLELLGTVGIGDVIPCLSWINRVNGFDKRVERVFREVDEFLECAIQEQMETAKSNVGPENFHHALLRYYTKENGDPIDKDKIKALILDIFIAGTDTTSTVLEWVMTELLRHPKVMEKLQNEVGEIVKDRNGITKEDLEKMHYLKAVIKETLRYHPPVPLLVHRVNAQNNVNVKGYDVEAGITVLINVFSLCMDPATWDEPEKFMPERFLNSSVDFRGLDFEFIPFGAGRRGCPGITFAAAIMEFVLANLVHKYNWELPDGAQGKDLDMSEHNGATVGRSIPLLAAATERK